MESVITAVVTAVATLLVCLINNHYQQKKADQDQDKRMTEMAHENEKNSMKLQSACEQAFSEMNAHTQQAIALLDCKFDDLTKKVEKHNCLVERTYKLESDSEVLKEKIRVMNHRVDDLEKVGFK